MKSWLLNWGFIIVFAFAGQNDTTLSFDTSEGTLISVDISPNGKTIAFDLLGHIYLMPSSGGTAEAITKGTSWNMLPRFSPDGEKILFTSDRSGSDDLWVQNIKTGNMKNSWAVHQLKTTVNFSTYNRFIIWFTGGLNHQIEHHIFPHISHIHYTKISEIVKKTAFEFNLPYNEYKTTRSAIFSHFKFLKQMGMRPVFLTP